MFDKSGKLLRLGGMAIALLGAALLTGCSKAEEQTPADAQATQAAASQQGLAGETGQKPTVPQMDPSK